jgi:hypothetical protein
LQRFFDLMRLSAGIIPLCCLPCKLEAAYKYPIGIPAAWIEPDVERPARPAPWTVEVPGYYYVNNTTGTDSGRPYGTPAAPRKTIPNPLGPGTYCEVSGIYTTNAGGWTILKGAGTAGAWVANTSGPAWIVGASATDRASFAAKGMILGSYLCMEYCDNLAGHQKFQISSTNATMGYEANHMLIRHCEIDGGGGAPNTAFSACANANGPAVHLVIYANRIHGFGPDTPESTDIDAVGFMVGGGVKHIWVLENEVFDMSGSGIVVTAMTTGPSTTSYVFVGKNHVYATWAAGIAAKTCDHVVFSENEVHDIKWTSWSAAKCIGAQYSFESLWILHNHCFNGDLGIKVGSSSGPNPTNVYAIGNVIHDIYDKPENPSPPGETGYSGAITIWGGTNRFIVGNTIFNCHNGIGLPSVSTTNPHSAVIENNIIANCLFNQIDIDLAAQYSVIRNNLLYQEGGSARLGLGNSHYTTSAANALAYVTGLIEADPQFADPARKDFSILAGSLAKDAALAPEALTFDVYGAYMRDFGIPINVDKTGTTRPQGNKWDIGAFEFPTSASNKVPKPSGVKIDPLPAKE